MQYWGERLVVRRFLTGIVAVLVAVVLWSPTPASAMKARATATSLVGREFTIAGALRWTGPPDESGSRPPRCSGTLHRHRCQDGGFLFADIEGNRVLRVSPGGRISVVAGGSEREQLGDGGPATRAMLNSHSRSRRYHAAGS